MGSSFPGGEMCMESGRAPGRRGGKKVAAADQQKATRQPQRGLGVAQLEKIRLHNQMMAAYRSGGLQDATTRAQRVPSFAAAPVASTSSFQAPYLTNCFEETDRGIVAVHYYDSSSLLPYGSSPPPPSLFAHDVRDSSGNRLGQPPPPPQHLQQHYWVGHGTSDGSSRSSHGSAEELDLELRL
ncbi:hypothetical protein BAE44_0006771 [Dichanthelium oligosanthes]|uniref:Protein SPEAR3 n=1 Tax=Dichanthelium oligosanthes TaxID=888268 RepID=A0A1E5W4B1_9POAL|nr:hypothetical protein BAE44_0006771 [Dichanthelium oligosanthes]